MKIYGKGALALAATALIAVSLAGCSSTPSCGSAVQTHDQPIKSEKAKLPLYPVSIEPLPGVRLINIYDEKRKDDLGYPEGQSALSTFMPTGTYVLQGFTQEGARCETRFRVS